MKKIYFLLLIMAYASLGRAQHTLEMGVGTGVTSYFGDLGNEHLLQSTSTRPGVEVTFRNLTINPYLSGNLYNPFSAELRLSWHRIGYDESKPIGNRKGFTLRNYGRGICFQNDIYGVSTHFTYTVYRNRRMPLHRQGVAMFFFAGAGIYYGKPVADLFRGSAGLENRYYFWNDGTTRDKPEGHPEGKIVEKDGVYETDLTKWSTERRQSAGEAAGNQKYKNLNVGFPMGFGFRFGLSKRLTLSAELGYYYFLTDYLDDVSDAYITFEDLNRMYPNNPEQQQLALYISDPTGHGTSGYPGPATSRRGNPAKNDSYGFVNLELAWKIEINRFRIPFLGIR